MSNNYSKSLTSLQTALLGSQFSVGYNPECAHCATVCDKDKPENQVFVRLPEDRHIDNDKRYRFEVSYALPNSYRGDYDVLFWVKHDGFNPPSFTLAGTSTEKRILSRFVKEFSESAEFFQEVTDRVNSAIAMKNERTALIEELAEHPAFLARNEKYNKEPSLAVNSNFAKGKNFYYSIQSASTDSISLNLTSLNKAQVIAVMDALKG